MPTSHKGICLLIIINRRLRPVPIWQQSGTLLFDSCDGAARFLEDELQTRIWNPFLEVLPKRIPIYFFQKNN